MSKARETDLFLDEFKNICSLKCAICLSIPHYDDAIEHKNCGHIFCSICISNIKKNECPLCKFPLETNRKIKEENLFLYRFIKSLLTKCDHEECTEIFAWESLEKHLQSECDYSLKQCKFGCGSIFLKKQESEHLTICLLKPVSCEYCSEEILAKDLKFHQENVCVSSPLKRIPCKFSAFGCEDKYTKDQEEEHMKINYLIHLEIVAKQTQVVMKENEELKKKIQKLEEHNKAKEINLLFDEEEKKNKGNREINVLDAFETQEESKKEIKKNLCVVCKKKAIYLCCNRPNATKTYTDVCFYMSCQDHNHHNSEQCVKQGRSCSRVSHNCETNSTYCGLISQFGNTQK